MSLTLMFKNYIIYVIFSHLSKFFIKAICKVSFAVIYRNLSLQLLDHKILQKKEERKKKESKKEKRRG